MKYRFLFLICLSFCFVVQSCGSRKALRKNEKITLDLLIHALFDTPEVHTGFYLAEAGQGSQKTSPIYEYQGDALFTPASNTKILTLYAALKFLPDPLIGLKWKKEGNSTLIRGTGDPGLLDRRFEQQPVLEFLQKQDHLVVTDEWSSERRWRPGWSWEDYPYYYAAQRSPLPVYGNMVRAKCSEGKWELKPKGFIQNRIDVEKKFPVRREEERNIYQVNSAICPERTISVPFVWSPEVLAALLTDTLKKAVSVHPGNLPAGTDWHTLEGTDRKEVLKTMMYESDNLIAEQLQWNISSTLWDTFDTRRAIDTLMHTDFREWKKRIRWVDGSGLSVYNKFSPRFLADILGKLYQMMPEEELFEYFPAGGVRGTISSWYDGGEKPYIYAKTGTLSSVTTLSGYLLADSGKTYIFSFMHSNYLWSAKRNKEKMGEVLRWIRENG